MEIKSEKNTIFIPKAFVERNKSVSHKFLFYSFAGTKAEEIKFTFMPYK